MLGLVLGSIMVERLTAGASQILRLADLVNRPVSGLLAAVIVVVIVFALGSTVWQRFRNV